jgi:hypothetical protein
MTFKTSFKELSLILEFISFISLSSILINISLKIFFADINSGVSIFSLSFDFSFDFLIDT